MPMNSLIGDNEMNYRMSDFPLCVPNFSLANTEYGSRILRHLEVSVGHISEECALRSEIVARGFSILNSVGHDAKVEGMITFHDRVPREYEHKDVYAKWDEDEYSEYYDYYK